MPVLYKFENIKVFVNIFWQRMRPIGTMNDSNSQFIVVMLWRYHKIQCGMAWKLLKNLKIIKCTKRNRQKARVQYKFSQLWHSKGIQSYKKIAKRPGWKFFSCCGDATKSNAVWPVKFKSIKVLKIVKMQFYRNGLTKCYKRPK